MALGVHQWFIRCRPKIWQVDVAIQIKHNCKHCNKNFEWNYRKVQHTRYSHARHSVGRSPVHHYNGQSPETSSTRFTTNVQIQRFAVYSSSGNGRRRNHCCQMRFQISQSKCCSEFVYRLTKNSPLAQKSAHQSILETKVQNRHVQT